MRGKGDIGDYELSDYKIVGDLANNDDNTYILCRVLTNNPYLEGNRHLMVKMATLKPGVVTDAKPSVYVYKFANHPLWVATISTDTHKVIKEMESLMQFNNMLEG